MIPKIIHYCWFGGDPKPEIIEKCIASWKKFCPDWEIKEWNETNYNVTAHAYTKEAYEAKKWAFVSDVARLEIVGQHGGIYLDTDVEILECCPFDSVLEYENILAFETERAIASGLCFGAVQNSSLCKRMLEPYLYGHYSKKTETVNSLTNKPVFEQMFPNLRWDGKTQIHGDTYIMGTDEYGNKMKHYGTRSWCDDLPDYKISGFWGLKKILRNPNVFCFLEKRPILKKIIPIYQFAVYDLLDLGPMFYIKRLWLKRRK